MRLANCETLLIPIVAYNCPGLLKLQSLSLQTVYLWGSDYTTVAFHLYSVLHNWRRKYANYYLPT